MTDNITDSDELPPSGRGIFRQCDPDPKGSVSKAWSFSLLFIIFFFGLAVFEIVSLEQNGASWPFLIAATWTAIIQLGMAVVGTFIIKRFSTPFSVGFLLGMVIFVAQQQLMLAVTFWHTRYGDFNTNIVFSNFSFALFVVYSFFGCILQNYREDIMVAAVDAKGFGRRKASEDRSVTDA